MKGGGPRSYADLDVWRRGIELAKEVYGLTDGFPPTERYGLASQMQRAAVSIPSNIAEGEARRRPREFRQFLRIALGSLAELDTQLVIADDLHMADTSPVLELRQTVAELQMMIAGLLPDRRD